MHAHGGIHCGIGKKPGLNHVFGTRKDLFRRLEHQLDAAAELIPALVQNLGSRKKHGGMYVMAAVVGRVRDRLKGKAVGFFHGERVHVSPEENGLAGAAALNQGSDARVADFPGGKPYGRKALHDIFSGSGQVLSRFGVLMQVAPVLLHLRFKFRCSS